jgi:hypothetical protein
MLSTYSSIIDLVQELEEENQGRSFYSGFRRVSAE